MIIIEQFNLNEVEGKKLIDCELVKDKRFTGSGSREEFILTFEDGKEIVIYEIEKGIVRIETD